MTKFTFDGPVYASAGAYDEKFWELDEDGNSRYISTEAKEPQS